MSRARSAGPSSLQALAPTTVTASMMLLILAPPRRALLGVRAAAEQLIEHRARIANHRQRLRRRRPRDRIGVGARVAVLAAARLIDGLDAELQRRDGHLLAEALRVELVDRRAGAAGPSLASASGAPASGTPPPSGSDRRRSPAAMNASAFLQSVLLTMVMSFAVGARAATGWSAPDRSRGRRPPATTGYSSGRRRGAGGRRAAPRCRRSARCPSAAFAAGGACRHHRVEQRQPQRDAHAFQHGAA